MPWPAYKTQLPMKFLNNDRLMMDVKKQLEDTSARSATQNVRREVLVTQQENLRKLADALQELIDVGPRAQAVAADLYDDGVIVVATEYAAVRNAANQLADWIDTNIPNGTALLTADDAEPDGTRYETYTPAQTATYRTHVATFAATIESVAP